MTPPLQILTPLRFLSLCNFARRAITGIINAHLSLLHPTLDVETFFADLRFASLIAVRLQRWQPPHVVDEIVL